MGSLLQEGPMVQIILGARVARGNVCGNSPQQDLVGWFQVLPSQSQRRGRGPWSIVCR